MAHNNPCHLSPKQVDEGIRFTWKMTGGGGSMAGSFVVLLAQLTVVLWQVFVQYY